MATKKTKEQKAELARLNKQMQDEQTKLMNDNGVFFAFGNDQFKEAIDKLKEKGYEGKVVSFGIGMYCRSDKARDFFEAHKELVSKYNKMKKAVSTFRTYAKMMFSEYESFYTGDVNDMCMNAILSVYPDKTEDEVNEYFNEIRYNISNI